MPKGRFIVIEGTDGSGKRTQTILLARTLRRQGFKVRTIAFPQYGRHSAAPIEAYLRGEYGSLEEVGAERASIFYAIDRVAARSRMLQWLKDGYVVISDRYITSNLAFQGAKIPSFEARQKFWIWARDFEFNLLGIPRPNLTLFLSVPAVISHALVAKKSQRKYLRGKKRDIHESNLKFQERVRRIYHELVLFDRRLTIVDCAPHGKLLPIKDIHREMLALVLKRLK